MPLQLALFRFLLGVQNKGHGINIAMVMAKEARMAQEDQ